MNPPQKVARRLPASGQTQVAFLKLDPILKELLENVTKYRELSDRLRAPGDRSDVSEQWVSNVKQQLEVLRRLQATIQTLGSPFAPSLLVLADYISLPLTAIFHISPQEQATNTNNNDSFVTVSYLRKLHQAAADCIQTYVQVVTPIAMHKDEDDDENSPSVSSLSSKHSIQFLTALTRGLPTTSAIATQEIANAALDDGSDCWLAILYAIQAVLKVCPTQELVQALEGGLVARLVDCATTLIEGTFSSKETVRLESTRLLELLLDRVADHETVWQAMFPGILVALYRCLVSCHRQASTGQSVALECGCLECIQKLLRITLVPLHQEQIKGSTTTNDDTPSTAATAVTMLQNLQLMARNNANETHRTSALPANLMTDDAKKSPDFLSQLQQRAVTPLILLLRQSIASTASSVCLQATHLCRVILVETNTCWSGTSLPEVAMECCLILQNTTIDATVAQAANSILQAYQQQLGTKELAPIVSKIRSLVGELPTLSQGGKTVDLKMHLQLLKGYLQALGPKAGKELAASTFQYQPLIQLMEVDFSAATKPFRPLPLLEVTGRDSSMYRGHDSKLPIQRLTLDNTKLAGEVIESFGVALGAKQGAFVVDALLSDVFEGWTNNNGPPSLVLLKEWTGSLYVATKVLIGAFSPLSCDDNSEPQFKKSQKRRRQILLSLAASILPLLVNAPVHLLSSTNVRDQLHEDELRPTTQAKQGIASMVVLALEFQAVMTSLLGKDTEEFVSILLYPTVDKVHSSRSSIVQDAAMDSFRSMASECGMKQVSSLLEREAVRLFADMLSRLRVPGGSSITRGGDAADTLAVASSLTWVLGEMSKANSQESPTLGGSATLSGLVKLGNALIDRLDHFFLDKIVSEEETFKISEMYSAFFRYMKLIFERDANTLEGQEDKENDISWLQLLSDFRKPCKEVFGGEGDEGDSTGDLHESCSDMDGGLTINKTEIDLTSKIIFMACYLLSNESLRVQIGACESLTWGFQFLALIAKRDQDNEEAEIRNAVFRQVATSWPSIKARLSNVTDEVVERKRAVTSLLVVSTSQAPTSGTLKRDIPTQRFFLSRLFQLVASMFECSGDFMADRFKSSVWPVIAKQFAFLMELQEKKRRTSRGQRGIEEVSRSRRTNHLVPAENFDGSGVVLHQWSDSERRLMLSMARCIARVFGNENSRGTCLVRIHQAVGLVLLPFVGDPDEEISSSVMDAIKNIVTQDCDVLLRPLLEISGRGIPPCPIRVSFQCTLSTKDETKRAKEITVQTPNAKLEIGCKEILAFIDQLPEQELK